MIGDGLPVIDLSDASTPTARQTVGKQLVRSIEQIGFFYVVGHGIEPRLATNAFDIAREFFSLNEAQKQKIAVNQFQRGWMRKGLTRLEGSVSADVKEVFFWGREVASNDPDVIGKLPLVAPNQWPDQSLPHFKQHILKYYHAVMSLGLRLLECIALGLDQNPDKFHQKYRKPLGRGQLVYYPPISDHDLANDAYSAAPHTDFGVLTILLQDSLGGFKRSIKTANGLMYRQLTVRLCVTSVTYLNAGPGGDYLRPCTECSIHQEKNGFRFQSSVIPTATPGSTQRTSQPHRTNRPHLQSEPVTTSAVKIAAILVITNQQMPRHSFSSKDQLIKYCDNARRDQSPHRSQRNHYLNRDRGEQTGFASVCTTCPICGLSHNEIMMRRGGISTPEGIN